MMVSKMNEKTEREKKSQPTVTYVYICYIFVHIYNEYAAAVIYQQYNNQLFSSFSMNIISAAQQLSIYIEKKNCVSLSLSQTFRITAMSTTTPLIDERTTEEKEIVEEKEEIPYRMRWLLLLVLFMNTLCGGTSIVFFSNSRSFFTRRSRQR